MIEYVTNILSVWYNDYWFEKFGLTNFDEFILNQNNIPLRNEAFSGTDIRNLNKKHPGQKTPWLTTCAQVKITVKLQS